jgi:hypothetical protein
MGGPHVDSNDHLTFIQGDYRTEEFARVKLQPDKTDNVFSPYTCATVTGVAFPYGQTNKGIIHPDINKIKTVLFRNKFTFDLVHPNVNEGPDLYNYDPTNPGTSTPGAAYYSPLYSSSIVNTYNGYTREFELKTNGYDLIQTYGLYGDALGPKNLLALSIHPELSRGETSSFFGPNSYTVNASPELAGAYSIGYPYDNIQYVVQGETDGTTVSFLVQSQPGCIIKGLIELF